MNTDLNLEHYFDTRSKRHYLNGHLTVMHCHHYSTLYTQLALDAGKTTLLAEPAEDSFYPLLRDALMSRPAASLEEKITLACEYYAQLGMGRMAVNGLGDDSGEVMLSHSHVDSGWLHKWGQYDAPVNYITAGYIAALCAAVLGTGPRAFEVREVQSIVMGAPASLFRIVRR